MQKPPLYPYEKQEYSFEELEKIKVKASRRNFNIFVDYNHVIYNLTCQLMEQLAKEGEAK